MQTLLVGLVLATVIGLAIRSLWKSHRAGQSCACSGDCSKCGHCR